MNPDEQNSQPEKPPVTLTDQELSGGEPCEDCGEVHEETYAKHEIEALVTKHTRRYRMLVAGYFASIALGQYGAYLAWGLGGPLMAAAAFGIFFFHTNMGFAAGGVDQLRGAVRMFDLKEAAEAAKGTAEAGSGLYL